MRWVYDRTLVVRGPDGQKLFNQGLIVDVTERKLAEVTLCQSEAKLRRILETAGEGLRLHELGFWFTRTSTKPIATCWVTPGRNSWAKPPWSWPPRNSPSTWLPISNRLKADTHRIIKGELVAKDGHVVPVLIHSNTLLDENGRPTNNVAFVTRHERAQQSPGPGRRGAEKPAAPGSPPRWKATTSRANRFPARMWAGIIFDFVQGHMRAQGKTCASRWATSRAMALTRPF